MHIDSLKSVELIFVLLTVKGEYDGQKIILNGVDKEEWKLRDNFITLNTPTAVDRVGIRATVETLKQIYAVSIFSLSLFIKSLFLYAFLMNECNNVDRERKTRKCVFFQVAQ